MSDADGFVGDCLARLKDALSGLSAGANLHLDHPVITRAMAARLKAGLRAIETMLRRLLLLMAVELKLAPVRKRPARTRDRRIGPGLPWHFELMPVERGDPSRLADLMARPAASRSPVRTGLILDRFRTMAGLLANPDNAARRMARLLERLKRRGAIRPWCPPQPRLHKFGHELGLIAGALPGLVNEALAGWYDTS